MTLARSLLLLLLLLLPPNLTVSAPPLLRGLLLDCGSSSASIINDLRYVPDSSFISSGVPRNLSLPNLLPTLTTLRSFPNSPSPRKFCYSLPSFRPARYLLRTTFFYGGVNGPRSPAPPVFDLIVDGTLWTVVNTTADYGMNRASYYEGVFQAKGKHMAVCLGANWYTDSDPFISSLEMVLLDDSVYNSTDFGRNAMGLIARSDFGSRGGMVRYPDDKFDRYWQPFTDINSAISSTLNISVSGFWNLPPANVLSTALVAGPDKPMVLQWPPAPLPESSYYIALYFADTLSSRSRMFNVYINSNNFYSNLEVTSSGLVVFSSLWNLSGPTTITLASESSLPPLINAGEVFGIFPIKGLTVTRDVIALGRIRKSITNPPSNWDGDPCMPHEYSWSGVTCSKGPKIRVVSLNLSNMGLSGSLSSSIGNLTALSTISFANNNLTGPIPDLSRLRRLENLHLQDNQFIGVIPSSLGDIKSLRELFLENNNLTGKIPDNLKTKPGLNLKVLPGNNFTSPP